MRVGALFSARTWPLVAAAVSAAMLAAAHAFQAAGYDPCLLCLLQREVYWIALALGLGGWTAARLARDARVPPVLCALMALVFLVGAGVAAFHAGVEWKWWPGLPACSAAAAGPVSLDDLNASLSGPIEFPRCDEAAWVFAGLSMAGWNALASLGLALASALAARRGESRL